MSDNSPLVTVKKQRSGTEPGPLFIVVGKGVSKKATERNLVKRRIRAILLEVGRADVRGTTIIARPAARTAPYESLKRAIVAALAG